MPDAAPAIPHAAPAMPAAAPLVEGDASKITISWSRSVAGPLQKKGGAVMISPTPMLVEGEEYFRFNIGDEWLCRLLTGKAPYKYPLAHTSIVNELKESVTQARMLIGRKDQLASAFGVGVGRKKFARRGALGKATGGATKKERVNFRTAKTVEIQMPKGKGSAETTCLTVVNQAKPVMLKLSIESLMWAFEWITNEDRHGSVTMKKQLAMQSDNFNVTFSRDRNAWVVKGPLHEQVFAVSKCLSDGSVQRPDVYAAQLQAKRQEAEKALAEQVKMSGASQVSEAKSESSGASQVDDSTMIDSQETDLTAGSSVSD